MKKMNVFIAAILLCAGLSVQAQISPQNSWKNLTMTDGLPSNDVRDVLIEDLSNVWIATSNGLSHYDGTSFTNYSILNSALNSNDIKELAFAQNKVWLITAIGLSSFDGTAFTNYTTANGLLSNTISGLTVTSTDTLWIGSTSGVSKYDGTNFVHDSSIVAYDIETDDMDRVYTILRRSIPVVSTIQNGNIYDQGVWTAAYATHPSYYLINDASLKKTRDGGLYLVSKAPKDYYSKISYPFTLDQVPIQVNGYTNLNPFASPVIDLSVFDAYQGKIWIGKTTGEAPILFSGVDSIFDPHFVSGGINRNTTAIDIKDSIIVLGTDLGFYLTSSNTQPQDYHEDFHINDVKTSVNVNDPLFSNNIAASANFEFPANSGNHGIYSANFIVVGKKLNQSIFNAYPINPFISAYSPGPYSASTVGYGRNYLVKISKQEIDAHRSNYMQVGYQVPQNLQDWPATGDTTLGVPFDLAPFVDVDNDQCYNPANGDYPLIKGDLAIYWINHPNDKSMELEYHWMMYAFDRPLDTALHQTIMVQYTVINRSQDVFDSLKVGVYVDGDLGFAGDDYVGCDSLNNIAYFYNGTLNDPANRGQSGYGNNTPALGIKFLSDTMSNLIYFNTGVANNGDPQTAQHWKNYLEAKWKNGQKLKYGGDGYNSAGVTTTATSHMFTGDPYLTSGWTELSPGPNVIANNPGDRRIVASMPYFSLQPNARKTMEFAYGFGRSPDTTTTIGQNINTMIQYLNHVENVWDTISAPAATLATTDSCLTISTSLAEEGSLRNQLKVYPIPTNSQLIVKSEQLINRLGIYDMQGRMVLDRVSNQKQLELDLSALPKGIYLLRAEIDGQIQTQKIMKSE